MEWGLGHGSPGLGGPGCEGPGCWGPNLGSPGFGRVLAVGDPGREMSCSQAGCQQSPGSAFLPEASGGPRKRGSPSGTVSHTGRLRLSPRRLPELGPGVCVWGLGGCEGRPYPSRPSHWEGPFLTLPRAQRPPPPPAQPMLLITRRCSVCSALALISQKWKRHLLSHGFAICNPRPSPQFNTNQPFCFQ